MDVQVPLLQRNIYGDLNSILREYFQKQYKYLESYRVYENKSVIKFPLKQIEEVSPIQIISNEEILKVEEDLREKLVIYLDRLEKIEKDKLFKDILSLKRPNLLENMGTSQKDKFFGFLTSDHLMKDEYYRVTDTCIQNDYLQKLKNEILAIIN